MLTLDTHVLMRVVQINDEPCRLPLNSGFSESTAYRMLGMFNPSETSDAYFILSNDRDEIWYICNRDLSTVGVLDDFRGFRVPLDLIARIKDGSSVAGAADTSTSTNTNNHTH